MGDKAPKLEEGEVLDRPPTRVVAPILANATPQQRLAAILRRIDAARTTCKPGAVEPRPAAICPPTRPSAHRETMLGYPGPPRITQTYTGPPTGYGDGSPGPGPSGAYQSLAAAGGGGSMAYGAGRSAPGPSPVVRGGGRDARNAGPVQQLSSECQRRRFNPEFKITMHDGQYKCDIFVLAVVVRGYKYCDNPQDAKMHTAIKALKTVRGWALPGPALSGGRQNSPQITKVEEDKENLRPSVPSSASGVDMSDPLQARAFVEGFRMGQLARVPDSRNTEARPDGEDKKRVSASLRSRSRSPLHRRRESRHRSRSPRRHFDGSRHDPSLPSTDTYRPTQPAPLRRDVDLVGAEDNYGRLKENDYY